MAGRHRAPEPRQECCPGAKKDQETDGYHVRGEISDKIARQSPADQIRRESSR